jgi:acetolactate synthase-1/2/3 large subunit
LVDLPSDVQKSRGEYRRPEGSGSSYPGYSAEFQEDLSHMDSAAAAIRRAERPVVISGNGVNLSRAYVPLRNFSEKLDIPVVTSLLGKGTISWDHPNHIGMMGMHGVAAANRAIMASDLIIAVGSRFSDRSTGKQAEFAGAARVIHIDADSAEIRKNIGADTWLIGDAGKILDLLADGAGGHDASARRAWLAEIRSMEEAEPLTRECSDGKTHPWMILDAIDRVTGGEAIITTEVGQHQMWTALYHRAVHPKRFITSGGLGTMGFGIPASIGAHFARPDLPVICIAGDGSAMMNIQELDTYARYNLPIKVMIFDNGCLGMVKQWQELFYDRRFSNTIYSRGPDFVRIAEGMGVEAFAADGPEGLVRSVERALDIPGPALVHFKIPQSDNVYPMVPAGESLNNMIL